MAAVIIGDNMNAGAVEKLGDMRVTLRMLAHAVRDLENANGLRRRQPPVTRNVGAVTACKKEGLHRFLGCLLGERRSSACFSPTRVICTSAETNKLSELSPSRTLRRTRSEAA